MTLLPNTESTEMLACPFCGAGMATDKNDINGVWLEKSDHDDPDYYVQCWSCLAKGREFHDSGLAVSAWNTRTTPAPDTELLEALGKARAYVARYCAASDRGPGFNVTDEQNSRDLSDIDALLAKYSNPTGESA